MSQPHFFQGAQHYVDAVDGMHPSDEHQTYIDVEPVSVLYVCPFNSKCTYIKPKMILRILMHVTYSLTWHIVTADGSCPEFVKETAN